MGVLGWPGVGMTRVTVDLVTSKIFWGTSWPEYEITWVWIDNGVANNTMGAIQPPPLPQPAKSSATISTANILLVKTMCAEFLF